MQISEVVELLSLQLESALQAILQCVHTAEQVPSFSHLSMVQELPSSQPTVELQAMPHGVLEQYAPQVPGEIQVSSVIEFESLQSASLMQAGVQVVLEQDALHDPASLHISIVLELLSLH